MKRRRILTPALILLSALLTHAGWGATPQHEAAAVSQTSAVLSPVAVALEAQTMAMAPKCVASTVGIVVRGKKTNAMLGSASGVLVSADGLILTAGHVVENPGTSLTIHISDGRDVQGVALGMDHEADTGMARITDPTPSGGWPFSQVAPADSAHPGDWVLATGHPGSIVIGRNPPLRLGRVIGHDKVNLLSNCAIEPGDSGGPLFDLTARVVGINSSIGGANLSKQVLKEWQTRHVPISLFSAQWKDLLAGKEAHPEAKDDNDDSKGTGTFTDLEQISEALKKLADQKDSEAKRILEDAKRHGGHLQLSADQVARLLRKAGLTPPPDAVAGEAKIGKGVPADLRPFLRPGIRHSLLHEMPNAKISDALLDRMMDKASFDLATAKMDLSPDLEDLEAMGLSPEAIAKIAGDPAQQNREALQFDRSSLQTLSIFAPALDAAGNCVVEVCSYDKPMLLGTIVDPDGWIVTKASDLPDHPTVVVADGDAFEAKVVGKDAATDLALLKIEARGLTAAHFCGAAPLGSWLASLVGDPNKPAIGVVSLAARPIPEMFSHFYGNQKVILGLSVTGDSCEVGEVTPGMPAEAAGVKAGDVILQLNGKQVSNGAELVSKVLQGKPGDTLTLKVRRHGKVLELKPVLGQSKTVTETESGIGEADEIAGGKLSKRRTNFPLAIQHDAAVWAGECGGPLINLRGQTVGVNIARYDQTCTFAIPADLVQKTVAKLRANARLASADKEPAVDNGLTLQVGNPAPALTPSKWVKGKAVPKFEPGKIYVVEFWATWCGPCRQSIPHLTELQKKYSNVTVIGMNCMERDPSVAAEFVETMADKMQYRVALDDAAGSVAKAWLRASGQFGIPSAFVVDRDSKIAWIGHPMKLDHVLSQVVAGTFDAKKEAAEAEAIARFQKTIESSDLDEIDKYAKDHKDAVAPLAAIKFNILLRKKNYTAAIALGRELIESQKDNTELLNLIAWSMVDPENPVDKPDLDLALKAALRANEVAKGERADVLDSLARVYFTRGDLNKAVEMQTKAVERADENFKDPMTKTLSQYKAGKESQK